MNKIKIIFLLILFPFLLYSQETFEYRLKNNLTLILSPDYKIPVAIIYVWVKCGSITEQEYLGSGISHFIEHLLFTTTKKHSTLEISQKIRELGADMNGWTSFENTAFYWILPSENIYKILPIVKEMIFEPAFNENEIKKEKEVILKEINMIQDSPDRFFDYLIFSSSYNNLYYKFPVIGYKDLFLKLKRDDILKYYKRMYNPNNIAIIIAGDIEPERLKEEVKKIFEEIPNQNYTVNLIPSEPDITGIKNIREYRDDVNLTRAAIVFKTTDIYSADIFPLDVLAFILGKGQSSILNKIFKENKKIVKSISASSYTPLGRGIFTIESEVFDYNEVENLKEEILNIFFNIKNYISEKDLEKAKLQIISDYYNSIETIEGKARDLGVNWALTGNINFSKYYIEKIKSVTLNDIIKIIDKYFKKDSYIFIILANSKYREEKIGIKKENNFGLKKFVLKNGIRVILNKNNSEGLISISIGFKGGQLYDENKPGLTYFLSKMLLTGTKKYSKDKIYEIIESKGGDISSFSGNNSFGIKVKIFKESLDETLKLISDILKNAFFSNEELEKERRIILKEIEVQDENIFGIGKKIMFKKIFNGYPYSEIYLGNYDSIKNITLEDIKRQYNLLIHPANIVLSISGDYETNIINLIENYFSDIVSHSNFISDEKEFKISKFDRINEFSTNIQKEQSLILIPFYGISVKNDKKDMILSDILFEFINGQGSRLFNSIREKKGLAYYVGLFPFYGLTTGLFVFYAGTTSDKIWIAKEEILKVINNIAINGITMEEFISAKRMVINSKLREFQSNESISLNYMFEELYKNEITDINQYKKIIDSLNLNDMNNFIKKYFNTKNFYVISLIGK